jgi:hypothetical protein
VLDGPAKLFDGDQYLSKAGVDSRLAGIKTGNSCDLVLMIEDEPVSWLEKI